MADIKLGSHVGMSGKDMFLNSVREAVSYGANTFMVYTGAPQNTRRKAISELNIPAAWDLMRENGIEENTLAYELRMEHLYEKYQMDEIHTGEAAENRETDEPERE